MNLSPPTSQNFYRDNYQQINPNLLSFEWQLLVDPYPNGNEPLNHLYEFLLSNIDALILMNVSKERQFVQFFYKLQYFFF